MPVIWAGFCYIAFLEIRPIGKFIIILFAIYAVLLHSSIITQLFMTESFARKRDAFIASRVMDKIYDVAPNFIADNTPVAFIGHVPDVNTPLHKRNESFGVSFWNSDDGNPHRMRYYLAALGVPLFKVYPLEKTGEIAESAAVKRMSAWPAPDFVQLHNGVLVVKLSEVSK